MCIVRLKNKRKVKRRLAVLNDASSIIVDSSTSSKPSAADVDLMPIQTHKKNVLYYFL